MSLETGRPRGLARGWEASSARPCVCLLPPPGPSTTPTFARSHPATHWRGRIQERPGLWMNMMSCATSALLPRRWAASSWPVGFGEIITMFNLCSQPGARHPLSALDLLNRYRLVRGAFASCCHCFVFVLSCEGWRAHGVPAHSAFSTSTASCCARKRRWWPCTSENSSSSSSSTRSGEG